MNVSDLQTIREITQALRLFVEPKQVTELRCLDVKQRWGAPKTLSGFFDYDHLEGLAIEAMKHTANALGTYFVLNPVNPALHSRKHNRVDIAGSGETTSDKDVLCRRWFFVDADPVRPAKISATDAEKAKALDVIQAVREHLHGQGWPKPILCDSGNGYHLYYGIDLPVDDDHTVERILKVLAKKFDTPEVKIDQTVFNPARVTKLFGSWSRKGDSTPERPHRQAKILEVPS